MWYFQFFVLSILLIATCQVVQSSSAGFTISVVGQNLIEADGNGEIPTYNLLLQANQPVTFVAQGIVMPRGKDAQASKPDSGTWLFNNKAFQVLPYDQSQFNETQIVVTLKPLESINRATRVRFVGNILGYDRKYDVMVRVNN
ncbi:hypothetical protein I4U23_018043 [Adineta vaga]|nr:hypothetical protein I4U23_018043 [Adineta vaga]